MVAKRNLLFYSHHQMLLEHYIQVMLLCFQLKMLQCVIKECQVMKHFGYLEWITQVQQHRVQSKNNYGRKKRKPSKTQAEKSLFNQSGIGRMNMDIRLIISLEGLEYQQIGIDLILLQMNKDQRVQQKLLLECLTRD